MSRHGKPAGFTAYVYEEDLRKIQELVQPYPEIETGGDLFGLWQDEKTVIIQRFIGPGVKCERTAASFHQDVDYLHRVGSLITTEEGLCNVGEWHSHHQIGMPEPSAADRRTVFSNMPHLGLERFVLFIATIEKTGKRGKRSKDVKLEEIKLNPYLFINSPQDILRGEIEIIPGKNPHDRDTETEKEIKKGAEKRGNGKKRASTSGEDDIDIKANGRTEQDRRASQGQDKGKSLDSRRSQAQGRESDKKENRSPNSGSAALSERSHNKPTVFSSSSQNAATPARGHHFQDGMPSNTSATTPSLWRTFDGSKKFEAAQQTGQPQYSPPTLPSQAASFSPPSGAGGNVGARQGGRGTSGNNAQSLQPAPYTNQSPGQDGRLYVDVSKMNAKGNF